MIEGGIFADLIQARWRWWHAKAAGDQAAIDKAWDEIELLLECIQERSEP